MIIKVYTDGACKGNPGQSGIGIFICNKDKEEVISYYECIGVATNNVAEYSAFLKSLELIMNIKENIEKIFFYSDSELMVMQLNGNYKVRDEKLMSLNKKAKSDLKKLNVPFKINYIPRTNNKIADKLANLSLKSFI